VRPAAIALIQRSTTRAASAQRRDRSRECEPACAYYDAQIGFDWLQQDR
jgi:hypothetical protein